MNCKEGDLALIVKSKAGNEGKIVRCIQFLGEVKGFSNGPRWRVEPPAMSSHNKLLDHAPDAFLRPIRYQGGDDESITWAGKPKREKAK